MKFSLFFRSHFGKNSSKVILVLGLFIGLLLVLGDHGVPRVHYIGDTSLSPQKGQFLFRFSRLMDTKSVETGFSIVPNVPGKFSWSGRTFAYTPDQAIAYQEKYTVTFGHSYDLEKRTMPTTSFTIATSPIAFAYLGSEGSHWGRILLHSLVGNDEQAVTDDTLVVQSFEVSPDGRFIAFLAADRNADWRDRKSFQLYLYDLESRAHHMISLDPSWILDNIRWLPDSSGVGFSYVSIAGDQEGIAMYELDSQKTNKIATGKARAYSYYFSPDSSQLAYIDTNGALILGSIPDGQGSLVATTFSEIAGFDDAGKYLAYIAPRSVSPFDLTNLPILISSTGEEFKVPVPLSSSFDLQFVPHTSQIVLTLEKSLGDVRDDHLYVYDYQNERLTQLTKGDEASDFMPMPSADGQLVAWLRFYNNNKGYVLSGWNDYQGKIIGGQIWIHDMITDQDTNTHLIGANVRFIP